VYSSPGVYTVSLTVTGPAGTNTKTSNGYITVTSSPTGCPCSLWKSGAAPTTAADPDTAAVELGVKFKSDIGGRITGIRYYKSSSNTGTHIGSLWSSDGRLLARATFTGETASGWQQANFATPVDINANTIYVASYHTNVGRYANDDNYFAAKGVDSGPLHALRNMAHQNNGVYSYGANPTFPRSTYRATNYWVDVVFN
jgi:PKD repeat protein